MAITAMIAATWLASVSGEVQETAFGIVLIQAPVVQAQPVSGNVKAKVKGQRRPCPETTEDDEEEVTDDQSVRGQKCKGGPGKKGK